MSGNEPSLVSVSVLAGRGLDPCQRFPTYVFYVTASLAPCFTSAWLVSPLSSGMSSVSLAAPLVSLSAASFPAMSGWPGLH